MPDDEAALIRAAQRGSLDAFNSLVLRYQDAVFTTAYRIMGETQIAADVAQDAFIIAYRQIATFRGGVFRAWLLRIAANRCYDELRRHKRRPTVSVESMAGEDSADSPDLPDPSKTPEQIALSNELQRAIQDCISALGAEQRVVLVMSDIDGLDYESIATAVGVALGTVKSRLSRARAAVRDCLSGLGELLPAEFRLSR
ncbi:MAG: RNA polymerase subunit sigma-24 [Phototrophicales bacterium]|nr:MAG: RNA polymerase subunit sigma-24 [Phototrophicales bacterium]